MFLTSSWTFLSSFFDSLAVFIFTRALDYLLRENRGSVNSLSLWGEGEGKNFEDTRAQKGARVPLAHSIKI